MMTICNVEPGTEKKLGKTKKRNYIKYGLQLIFMHRYWFIN